MHRTCPLLGVKRTLHGRSRTNPRSHRTPHNTALAYRGVATLHSSVEKCGVVTLCGCGLNALASRSPVKVPDFSLRFFTKDIPASARPIGQKLIFSQWARVSVNGVF